LLQCQLTDKKSYSKRFR